MAPAEWQKGEGSPCGKCWMKSTCAADDKRCQEWISWFYRDFRRRWRNLRALYGIRDSEVVWQYRAPYEPGGAAVKAGKEDDGALPTRSRHEEEPPAELMRTLEELDELVRLGKAQLLGERLRALKKELGYRQQTLAGLAGCGGTTISRMHKGVRTPTWVMWEKIRKAIVIIWRGSEKGERK